MLLFLNRCFLPLMGWRFTCGGLTVARGPSRAISAEKLSATRSAWSNIKLSIHRYACIPATFINYYRIISLENLTNHILYLYRKGSSAAKSATKVSRGRPLCPRTSSSTRTPDHIPVSTAANDSTRNQI